MSQQPQIPLGDSARLKAVTLAAWVATLGNLLLALIKVGVGLATGSLAVLSDGIDTAVDVGMGVLLLLAAPFAARPPDARYPFGRKRAEAMVAKLLAVIIVLISLQLGWAAIGRVTASEVPEMPGMWAIWVTLFSIVAKLALASNQYRLARRSGSAMVLANAVNMRNDVITSIGVLAGLSLSRLWDAPLLDPLTALIVAGWILKSGIDIYRSAARELMDGVSDPEVYERVATAAASVPGAHNPHRIRARQLADRLAIDLDVEVDGSVSVNEGHRIAHLVEDAISAAMPEVIDCLVHIEPLGHGEAHDTSFGVNPVGECPGNDHINKA
ncbi:MAG: cation transporter [Planctomycetota bacterium]|nr:MAG: cation transporter [Planctomycetota bacterium]